MKTKFILLSLILISSIIFVSGANYPAPTTDSLSNQITYVTEDNSDKFEDYSSQVANALDKEVSDWTKRDACYFLRGCYESKICYPFGYIKEGNFCSEKIDSQGKVSYGFSEQKSWGNSCQYDFECDTNLCFKGTCSREIEFNFALSEKIKELEEKIKNLEEKFSPSSEQEENSITGNVVSEKSQERKGFFSWFRK